MTEIKTLSEFIDWASQFKDRQYLFRGVPNDTFNIQASTYLRLPEADRNNPSELLRINKDLINEARTLGHDMRNGLPLSDLELLAELQHFGAATCLIDFSRSALSALWFACLPNPKKEKNGEVKEKNGRVFAVSCDKVAHLRTITPELITENLDYFFEMDKNNTYPLYEWTPKLQNNRIIAQHSVFLFGRDQIEADAECVIIKCHKQEILKSLKEVSDIREATMYPDFDGFARQYAHNKPYVKPDAQGLIESGVEAHKRDDLPRAINFYNRAIERDPNNANAYTYRGVAYNSKGEYDNAIGDFNKAIERNPNNANAYNRRGIAYNGKGEYDNAIGDFNRAIERNPNDADAYTMRGIAYTNKEEYDNAIGDFNKAIERDPNNAYAYTMRGIAYDGKGEYDNAFEDFNRAIERDPNNDYAYNSRGIAYNRKREYDNAIGDFNKAIELNPNYANAYTFRGVAYNSKGEYDNAIGDFSTAIERDSNNAYAYNSRGITWLHLGEWQNAKSDLTTAKRMGEPIITRFQIEHESVSAFEQKYCIQLPPDITTLLTTP